jgi:UDP-glucose 4-epimerase
MSILVTGGAGFIGSHTCQALAAQDLSPVAFDNLSRGHAEFVRWGPLEEGDILNASPYAQSPLHTGTALHLRPPPDQTC